MPDLGVAQSLLRQRTERVYVFSLPMLRFSMDFESSPSHTLGHHLGQLPGMCCHVPPL